MLNLGVHFAFIKMRNNNKINPVEQHFKNVQFGNFELYLLRFLSILKPSIIISRQRDLHVHRITEISAYNTIL